MTNGHPTIVPSRELTQQLSVQLLVLFLCRNIILKISIIGILCYYWLDIVAESKSQVKFQKYASLTHDNSLGTTLVIGLLQQREVHGVLWTAEFPTPAFLY